jgi:hypothetical protein
VEFVPRADVASFLRRRWTTGERQIDPFTREQSRLPLGAESGLLPGDERRRAAMAFAAWERA